MYEGSMNMGKYESDARKLLEYVGGKENIGAVTHCMTRMRFALVDPAKADTKQIEALSSVKGTFTQAGQFQVIIGNDVQSFYNDFVSVSGVEGVSKDEVKKEAKGNLNLLQRAVADIAEIFAPLIPAIIVGGLILGFRNIIGEINLMNGGTQTLIQVSQFWQVFIAFFGSSERRSSISCRLASPGLLQEKWEPPRSLELFWGLPLYLPSF